jgi:hypothetical protein
LSSYWARTRSFHDLAIRALAKDKVASLANNNLKSNERMQQEKPMLDVYIPA